jgi:hypothetical protein
MQVAAIFPAPTPAGSYDQASENPVSVVNFQVGPSAGEGLVASTSGTAELTAVAERLQMTFSFVADGVTYEGTVDVEARP